MKKLAQSLWMALFAMLLLRLLLWLLEPLLEIIVGLLGLTLLIAAVRTGGSTWR